MVNTVAKTKGTDTNVDKTPDLTLVSESLAINHYNLSSQMVALSIDFNFQTYGDSPHLHIDSSLKTDRGLTEVLTLPFTFCYTRCQSTES